MTNQEIWISVLVGILVNIVTGAATYLWTSARDKAKYAEDSKAANAKIADIAVNHLYGTYLANRRLRMDVLSKIGTIKKGETHREVFIAMLDGIALSLEQERISIIPNMNIWKPFLLETTESYKLLVQLQKQDFIVPTSDLLHSPQSGGQDIKDSHSTPRGPQHAAPNRATTDTQKTTTRNKELKHRLQALRRTLTSPAEEAMRALLSGDPAQIRNLRDRYAGANVPPKEKLLFGATLATIGDRSAIDILKEVHADINANLDADEIQVIIGSIVQVAISNDIEAEVIPYIEDLVAQHAHRDGTTDKSRAWILNQLQKLHYGAGNYARAKEILDEVLRLAPSDPSYLYNRAGVHYKLGDRQGALDDTHRMLATSTDDADHLMMAFKILRSVGETDKAAEILRRLEAIDEFKAALAEMPDSE